MRIVPLVAEVNGQKEIIGEARIDSDGNMTGIIKKDHPMIQTLLAQTNYYSFIVTKEKEK